MKEHEKKKTGCNMEQGDIFCEMWDLKIHKLGGGNWLLYGSD